MAISPTSSTNPSSSDLASILGKINTNTTSKPVTGTVDGNTITSDAPVSDTEGGDKVTSDVFGKSAKRMGKQDFLNLLVTQLKYQDPLSPAENTEFVAQLAQFSSLEGTQNMGTSMEDLNKNIQALVAGQSASAGVISDASMVPMIGKQVRVQAPTVAWTKGATELSFNVHTEPGTASVISLLDKDEKIVNVLEVPKAGENTITWTGLAIDGSKVPSGTYSILVTNKAGADTGYAYLDSIVSGIAQTPKGMRLEVNGQLVALEDIVHVGNVTEKKP